MAQEYLHEEGMVDYEVQEVSDNVALFLFNPRRYRVSPDKAALLAAELPRVEDVATEVYITEVNRGLITLYIDSIEEHYIAFQDIKNFITKRIKECEND